MFNELISPNVTYSNKTTTDSNTTDTASSISTSMAPNVFGATIATHYNFKYSDLLDVGIIIITTAIIITIIVIIVIIRMAGEYLSY